MTIELYRVKKDGVEFYIQPEMIESYSLMGYEVYKLVETLIDDVKAEAELITAKIKADSIVKIEEK